MSCSRAASDREVHGAYSLMKRARQWRPVRRCTGRPARRAPSLRAAARSRSRPGALLGPWHPTGRREEGQTHVLEGGPGPGWPEKTPMRNRTRKHPSCCGLPTNYTIAQIPGHHRRASHAVGPDRGYGRAVGRSVPPSPKPYFANARPIAKGRRLSSTPNEYRDSVLRNPGFPKTPFQTHNPGKTGQGPARMGWTLTVTIWTWLPGTGHHVCCTALRVGVAVRGGQDAVTGHARPRRNRRVGGLDPGSVRTQVAAP